MGRRALSLNSLTKRAAGNPRFHESGDGRVSLGRTRRGGPAFPCEADPNPTPTVFPVESPVIPQQLDAIR